MAGVNIANNGLTLTRYLTEVTETLNHESKARSLTRKNDKWTGAHIEWRVHTGRTGAIKYTEDGGTFPTPNAQKYQPAKATRKFSVGKIQLTDGVMATASGNKNVARDVIRSEVDGMMRDMLKYENWHFFRDGTASVGTLIDAGLASGATDIAVDDGRFLSNFADGGSDGMELEVRDSSASFASLGTVKVKDVEQSLNASNQALVNFDALLAGSAADDILVPKDSYNIALTGLDSLIADSGTFQTINTATYPRYTSHVLDNSGTNRALTPSLFRQMLAGLKQKAGSDAGKGLSVLTNNWQAINVEELYEGELRLTPSSKVGGLSVASFQSSLGRIDIMPDVDAPYNTMFFVDFNEVYRAVQKPLAWRRQGGSIFKRSDVSGVHTATAIEICDLYIKARHTSGKLQDLSEDPSIAY